VKLIVNLNEKVKVALTDHGKKIAEDSGIMSDEDIESGVFQLHHLMYVFGRHSYTGSKLSFFMNDIELLKVTYEKD
jgi:hypothetical protein